MAVKVSLKLVQAGFLENLGIGISSETVLQCQPSPSQDSSDHSTPGPFSEETSM